MPTVISGWPCAMQANQVYRRRVLQASISQWMDLSLRPLPFTAGTAVQANMVYRWRIVQASISKWMDLSLDRPGCQLGLYARDGNFLRALPRAVTNLMAAAANRLELLAVCQPSSYQLR